MDEVLGWVKECPLDRTSWKRLLKRSASVGKGEVTEEISVSRTMEDEGMPSVINVDDVA